MNFRKVLTSTLCLVSLGAGVQSLEAKETKSAKAQMSTKPLSKEKQNNQAATDLAQKVLNAYGGLDKIKQFQNTPIRETGKLEQISSISGSSNTLPCELITLKNKQHLKSNFMGHTVITCFDGKDCWTQQGDNALPTDRITSERVREDQMHGMLLLETLLEPDRQLKIGDPQRIKGKKCITLIVTADDGKPSKFFIDPKTFLIVRNEYEGTDSEQGIKCTKAFDFGDYRDVDGFKSPFQLTEYSGSKKVSYFEVDKIETNIKLTNNFFSLPKQNIPERLKRGTVIVPFKLISNEVVVKAKVNGEKDLYFLVDTGATQSILDTETAKTLGAVQSGDFSITTGSGAMKMQFMTLNSIRLGDLTLNDIPVAVAPLKKFSNNLLVKPAGLIGANILKRFLLTIDYPNERIELRAPKSKIDMSKGILVSTKPSLGVSGLAVDGIIDGKLELSFLLDSGAAFNHVSENLVDDLLGDTPILSVGSVKGLDAKKIETGAIKFNNLKIGDLEFNNPVFSIAPSPEKPTPGLISGGNLAIIGNPFLSQYRITIFYQDQKILFEKPISKVKEENLLNELNRITKAYRQHENLNHTLAALQILSKKAVHNVQYGAAAEILARYTFLAATNDKINKEKMDNHFVQATKYATVSKNKEIESNVLSTWAHCLLIKKHSLYMDDASSLITKALRSSPTQSYPYTVTGLMLLDKQGKAALKSYAANNPPKAVLFLNQSLMLNPASWYSLWTMHELAKTSGRKQEMAKIEKLLSKYHPNAKRVRNLANLKN